MIDDPPPPKCPFLRRNGEFELLSGRRFRVSSVKKKTLKNCFVAGAVRAVNSLNLGVEARAWSEMKSL